MSFRFDSLRVTATVYKPGYGFVAIDFSLPQPIDPDDPLVVMVMERNRQINEAAARAAGPANPFV
jgi:hypothetical protein